jgi:hypothetical protein
MERDDESRLYEWRGPRSLWRADVERFAANANPARSQIAGVVVSRWRTLIRAAAGREYILRNVHLVRDRTGVETFSRNVRSRESRKRKQSR